jgi:hypothetical protein
MHPVIFCKCGSKKVYINGVARCPKCQEENKKKENKCQLGIYLTSAGDCPKYCHHCEILEEFDRKDFMRSY